MVPAAERFALAMLEYEGDSICRDDRCKIEGVHARHPIFTRHEKMPHHRPGSRPWLQPDRQGLMASIMKATSKRVPRWFQEISPEVRDDYGDVGDRTIWRGIAELVQHGRLMRLDIGLAFHAYIQPVAPGERVPGRMERPDEVRDYMLSIVEIHPTGRESY